MGQRCLSAALLKIGFGGSLLPTGLGTSLFLTWAACPQTFSQNMTTFKTALFFILIATSVVAQDLPRQEGFTWWKIPTLKGAMLVPDGWHTKEQAKGATDGFYISKSEITVNEPTFQIGLTLNVFKRFKAAKGKDPLVWAKEYRETLRQKGKVLDSWDKDMGPFKSLGIRVKVKDQEGSLIMHHLFVVNPKTGTLYFYLFEAPEGEWAVAWKSGEKMMKLLLIDDTI